MSRNAHGWQHILNPIGSEVVILVKIRPKPIPAVSMTTPGTGSTREVSVKEDARERDPLYVRVMGNPNQTNQIKDFLQQHGQKVRSVTFQGAYEFNWHGTRHWICLYKLNDADLLSLVDRFTPDNLERWRGFFIQHPNFVAPGSHKLGEHTIAMAVNLTVTEINFIWA